MGVPEKVSGVPVRFVFVWGRSCCGFMCILCILLLAGTTTKVIRLVLERILRE